MALGADYSWARPGGAALRAAGVTAVGRYLASDGRGITAAEYQDLQANGIGVWLCREGSANGMLGGFAQGVTDAQIAEQQIAAAGLPADSVVHATADFAVSSSQFPICDQYMQGFGSVLGANRRGIYGGLHYLNHCYTAGLAVSFWQAGATSWDNGESPLMQINFHQTTLSPPLPGTDHNFVYTTTTLAGSGATLLENDLTPEEHDALLFVKAAILTGGTSMPDGHKSIGQSIAEIHSTVAQTVLRDGHPVTQIQDNADTNTMVRQLTADVAALQAALGAVTAGGVDPATIQAAAKAGAQEALASLVLKAS